MTAKKDGGKCMLNTRVGLGQSEVVDVLMSASRTRRRVNTGTCERRGMRVVKMSSTDGCTVSAGRERAGLRRRAFLSADGLAVWGASGRGADLAGSRGGGTCQLGGPRWAGRGTHRGVGLAGARGSGEGDREGRGPVGGLEAAVPFGRAERRRLTTLVHAVFAGRGGGEGAILAGSGGCWLNSAPSGGLKAGSGVAERAYAGLDGRPGVVDAQSCGQPRRNASAMPLRSFGTSA